MDPIPTTVEKKMCIVELVPNLTQGSEHTSDLPIFLTKHRAVALGDIANFKIVCSLKIHFLK